LPHPSPAGPHWMPCWAHVFGVHVEPWPQTPDTPPPPQASPGPQEPQSSTLPQPSPAGPHVNPRSAHASGVQGGLPQTLAIPPPPHVSPTGHVPQARRCPHPSPMGPQFAPAFPHVVAPGQELPPSYGANPVGALVVLPSSPMLASSVEASTSAPGLPPGRSLDGARFWPQLTNAKTPTTSTTNAPKTVRTMRRTLAAGRGGARNDVGWKLPLGA
jgi:hypothetical protein